MYLSPLSSYSNKASRNRVLFNSPDPTIRPIASAKAWLLPMLSSSTKTSLNTQNGCGKCLSYQPFKCTEMERLRKIYNELWVQQSLTLKVYGQEFCLRSTPQHMWVMGVYIVWVQKVCIRYDNSAKQNVSQVSHGKALPARYSQKPAVSILS